MRTAIDTSILVDLLLDDPKYAESSRAVLVKARSEGALVVGDVVLAELGPLLDNAAVREFLDDLQISYVPPSIESAILAGEMLASYLGRGGKRGRIVPDFLIGAHAQLHSERLLARDRGFFRDYFKELPLIVPKV